MLLEEYYKALEDIQENKPYCLSKLDQITKTSQTEEIDDENLQ